MKTRFKPQILALAALASMAWQTALAQDRLAPTQVEAKIENIKAIIQKTPEFQATVSDSKKDPRRREWLEVEVEFETKSNSPIGIVPEVLVQYYVAVEGAGRQIQVLSDSYTYTNVVDGEESFVVVYVSPYSLARVNGEMGGFKLRDVKALGVEILFNGRVVAEGAEGLRERWWTQTQAPRKGGLLSPKEQTPFSLLWIDRYLELKPLR